MQKYLYGALFATLAGALTFGAAASLTVTSENLGAGSTGVVSCDDEVFVDYGLLGDEFELVGSVFLRDVAGACQAQLAYVTVSDELSRIIGTGQAIVDGPDVNVVITPTAEYSAESGLSDSVLAADVYEVSVTISGEQVTL